METGQINPKDKQLEWFCLKASFLFFWISNMGIMLYDVSVNCTLHVGICKWIDFSWLFTPVGKWIWLGVISILSLLYLAEKSMVRVTFLMTLCSILITSYHESNGIQHHATIFSCILGVQFIAYLQKILNPTADLSANRVQYSLQIIAAMYVLAGISKLNVSGLEWIHSGRYFAIQVVKNFSFIYFADGKIETLNEGFRISNELLANQEWISLFLGLTLVLELGCMLALLWPGLRMWYGLALTGMHLGIKWIMAIPFGVIAPPMIIYFINPLYQLVRSFKVLESSLITILPTNE